MAIAVDNDIIQTDLQTLADLANSKLSPGTAYAFGASSNDWLLQLNRIRTDLYALIFGDGPPSPLTDFLVSDPQCVGINPSPIAWRFLNQVADTNGKLFLGDASTGFINGVPLFKEISFIYAAVDADFTFGNPDINFSVPYLTMGDTDAKLYWGVSFAASYIPSQPGWSDTGSAPNRTFAFDFNYTAPVDATLWLQIKIPLVGGGFDYSHSLTQSVPAGSGTVHFSATGNFSGVPVLVTAECFWPGTTTTAAVTAIHPSGNCKQISIDDPTASDFAFILDGRSGPAPFVTLNLPSLRGMWMAKTLPTPAVNGFLDMDFPPYVQNIVGYEENPSVGTALDESFLINDSGKSGYVLNPRTAMRQPSPTLPRKALPYSFVTPALAINANYSGSFIFPDSVTLEVYGGPGNTGADPFMVLGQTLPIYVSLRSGIDPTNSATYDLETTTGGLTFAQIRAFYDGSTTAKTADGKTLYFLVHNNSGAAISALGVTWADYVLYPIWPVPSGIIQAQPAVWPVMRDTDAYPWFQGLDPYREVNPNGPFTIANGATLHAFEVGNPGNSRVSLGTPRNWQFSVSPTLPLYVSQSGWPNPSNPATYDFIQADGIVTLAELQAHYGASATTSPLYILAFNNTGSTQIVTFTERTEIVIGGRWQQMPIFFPSLGIELDPVNQASGVYEYFSNVPFESDSSDDGQPNLIPQRGYEIYNVLVRRRPVLTGKWYLPPTDMPELDVDVGFFTGLAHTTFEAINKGTFNSLVTVTIPEGELEAEVAVSWPVLYGTMLVYQASESVFVEARVNFQPIFHNKQFGGTVLWPAYASINGLGCGDASVGYLVPACRFQNWCSPTGREDGPDVGSVYVQFPIAPQVINDLIAALDLL